MLSWLPHLTGLVYSNLSHTLCEFSVKRFTNAACIAIMVRSTQPSPQAPCCSTWTSRAACCRRHHGVCGHMFFTSSRHLVKLLSLHFDGTWPPPGDLQMLKGLVACFLGLQHLGLPWASCYLESGSQLSALQGLSQLTSFEGVNSQERGSHHLRRLCCHSCSLRACGRCRLPCIVVR